MSGRGEKAKSGQSEGGRKQKQRDHSEKKQDDCSLRSLDHESDTLLERQPMNESLPTESEKSVSTIVTGSSATEASVASVLSYIAQRDDKWEEREKAREERVEWERHERELKVELLRLEMEERSDRDRQAQEAKEERLRQEAEEREVRNRLEMELLKKQLERVSASIEKEKADRQSARDSLAATTCEVEDWALKRGAYTKRNRAIERLVRCQDSDNVEYYLERFEKIMEDGEIPGEEYLDYLRYQFSEGMLIV